MVSLDPSPGQFWDVGGNLCSALRVGCSTTPPPGLESCLGDHCHSAPGSCRITNVETGFNCLTEKTSWKEKENDWGQRSQGGAAPGKISDEKKHFQEELRLSTWKLKSTR